MAAQHKKIKAPAQHLPKQHYRMWKSGKKWLYGFTAISLLVGGAGSGLLSINNQKTNPVFAATTSSGTLIPGATVNMGNPTTFGISDLLTPANWDTAQNNNPNYPQAAGNSWLDMTPNAAQKHSVGMVNRPFDMSQNFSFSGSVKTSVANNKAGDYLGFILTPGDDTAALAATSNWGSTSFDLNGIANIPNAVFMGRDYWVNNGPSNSIQISQNSPTGAYTGASALHSSSTGFNNAGETISITWVPTADNGDGTVTGNMTMVLNGTTVSWPGMTLSKVSSFGVVASTGGNYSVLSVNLSTISSTLATTSATVNYINKITGQAIMGMSPTTLTNVPLQTVTGGVPSPTTLGVVAPGSTPATSDSYDYVAPAAPVGYKYDSVSSAITISNINPNSINVYYTPDPQVATFDYNWDTANTPGAASATTATLANGTALPASISTSGYTDGAIPAPTLAVPIGYEIKGYQYNGLTYSSLAEAEAAYNTDNPGFFSATVENPTFIVVLSASAQYLGISASYAEGTPGTSGVAGSLAMSLPASATLSGLTGGSFFGSSGTTAASGGSLADSYASSAFPSYAGYTKSYVAYQYDGAGSVTASSSFSTFASAVAYESYVYTATSPSETDQLIEVVYSANAALVAVNTSYAGSSFSSSETTASYTGKTGGIISQATGFPTDNDFNVSGFFYTVTGPDGSVYSTLSSAASANAYFDTTADTSSAISQIFSVTYYSAPVIGSDAFYNGDPAFHWPTGSDAAGNWTDSLYDLSNHTGSATSYDSATGLTYHFTESQSDGSTYYTETVALEGTILAMVSNAVANVIPTGQGASVTTYSLDNAQLTNTLTFPSAAAGKIAASSASWSNAAPASYYDTNGVLQTSGAVGNLPSDATVTVTPTDSTGYNGSAAKEKVTVTGLNTTGTYTFYVTYTDSFGNQTTVQDTLTVDLLPSTLPYAGSWLTPNAFACLAFILAVASVGVGLSSWKRRQAVEDE